MTGSAGLPGGGGGIYPAKTTQFYGALAQPHSGNTGGLAVGTLHLTPFPLGSSATVDRMSVALGGGGGVGACSWVGIYAHGSAGPGVLMTSALLLTPSLAVNETTVPTVRLVAGMYWLAILPKVGTATFRVISGTDFLSTLGYPAFDATGPSGAIVLTGQPTEALPSPFPSGWTMLAAGAASPRVCVRLSAIG